MNVQKLATAICSTRDLERRRLICDMAIHEVGGFASFLRRWRAAILEIVTNQRSSPRLLRMFELLWELQLEQDQRNRLAVDNTSDEDLAVLIDRHLHEMIKRDPSVAVHAAIKMGWRLIPPRDQVV